MKFSIFIEPNEGDKYGGYTFFSLPFSRGQFFKNVEARVGNERLELWTLGHWPDGSLRMVQGLTKRISGNVELEVREVDCLPEHTRIINPKVAFDFYEHHFDWNARKGLHSVSCKGVVFLESEQFVQEFETAGGEVARCVPDPAYQPRITHFHRHWLQLAYYFQGETKDGKIRLRFRLLVDVFAGIPGCVLSIMTIHDCPGVPHIDLQRIDARVGLSADSVTHGIQQKRCGFELTESRSVETGRSLDVRVDGEKFAPRIANFEALEDTTVYPAHLNPPPDAVDPLCWLNDGTSRVIFEYENMAFLRPKGMKASEGRVTFSIWPEWADTVRWKQGCRRQVRVAIGVQSANGVPDIMSMRSLTAALLNTRRAQLLPEAYRISRFFDMPWLPPFQPARNPRIEGWISAVSTLRTSPVFFDFGDTRDSHYTRTYYPLSRVPLKKNGVDSVPGLEMISGRTAFAADGMDARKPVFVNNEYDVLHCLASEYLRSGNILLFSQLQWFARHTIEVDFICFNDHEGLHRAQGAHSVEHTSGGAYPSHFWTQGLAQYYFLTGDEDALEVIVTLAEKTIWYFEHPKLGKLGSGINREMGWAVLTLVSAYEVTLKPEFIEYARHLIDAVIGEPLPKDLPVFSFGHTSLLLGCKAYLEALGHAEKTSPVRAWYLAVVKLAVSSAWHVLEEKENALTKPKLSYDYERLEKGTLMGNSRSGVLNGYAALACLSYAWRLSGDRSLIEAGLRTMRMFMDDAPGYFENLRFRHPIPEGKPFAMSYRTMMEFFQALDECGLLEEFEFR